MSLRERLSIKPAISEPLSTSVPIRGKSAPVKLIAPTEVIVRTSDTSEWWVFRIPMRLWFIINIVAAPFKALIWILDGLVALSVLAVIGVVWAWWTQHITDDQVAGVIGEIGARGLSILSKAKIL